MTDVPYNHYHKDKKPSDYIRIKYRCSYCKTPIFVNREKYLPKFCMVCHMLTSWKVCNDR